MDSKRMRRALFAMVGMFLLLIAVIALMNLETVKSKLGLVDTEVLGSLRLHF